MFINILIIVFMGTFADCVTDHIVDVGIPEVMVEEGRLRGTLWKTRKDRVISAFLGIPYAEPPIGELRFQSPVPAKPWEGIRNATVPHAVCPQRVKLRGSEEIHGEEDCLFLNVYTPTIPRSPTRIYPVLVFIHGGRFSTGSGNSIWYGPDIILDKDVVLVIPNYRLGVLGLLSTGDETASGNYALKDQNLALKWVKRNIENFGGDSNNVLLFGESSGAVCTHLHVLSPMSQGLFHAAISQSGTALAPWGLTTAGRGGNQSKKLAKALNCPTASSQQMLKCLRILPAYEIIAKDREWDVDPFIPFKPVIEPNIEGAFITEHPAHIIKSGKSADIPWVVGINTGEGALRAAELFDNVSLVKDLDRNFMRNAPVELFYSVDSVDKDTISTQIRDFYFEQRRIDNTTRFNLVDMYTDAWFLSSADLSISLHKRYSKSPVYYYLFGNHGINSFSKLFGDKAQRYGVCHCDELQYLFPTGNIHNFQEPDALDQRTSELLTTLWTNFAQFGNPTPKSSSLIYTKWEPVQDLEDFEYYFIGSGVHRAKGLLEARAKFWRKLPIHARSLYKDEL